MVEEELRDDLAEQMAGEVVCSDDPGGTIRKWRTEFGVAQTALAEQLDVSPSVVSDYESGRRANPGIGIVRRVVEALLAIDERRGGDRIRQYGRVLSAGFDSDVVLDLREYAASVPLERLYDAVGATEVVRGRTDAVAGHTVIDSIEVITRLSGEEFYRLYGQSTNRALVFTNISRGESPLVAMRVVNPTPAAVVLHGIDREALWDHAAAMARIDDFSLAVTDAPLDGVIDGLAALP